MAGAAAVAGLATWVGTRPADPGLPDPVVTREQNPAGIEWYANRVLHLEEVSLELPQLEELVPVPDGVVYGGRDGLVVLVDAAGKLTALGERAADTTVVGSAERGWVAWVETGEGSEELVVYDTLTRQELARREVSDAVTIALDQDRVYYTSGGYGWTWQVPDGEPEAVAGDLLDVSSAVRVVQDAAGLIRISQPLFNIEHTVPGVGALVAPDGDHVLTRVADPLPDTVVVYDAITGDAVPSGVRAPEVAVAAAFGPDDTVVYVLAQRAHAREGDEFLRLSTSGPLLLRTCDLELSTCETNSQFANAGNPVLPR